MSDSVRQPTARPRARTWRYVVVMRRLYDREPSAAVRLLSDVTLHAPYSACDTISGVRILVVEDEAGLRDGIADLLRGDAHTVTALGDGAAGVEAGLREPFDV